MNVKLWHALVFVVALVAFSIARAPASLLAPQRENEFTYERALGTIWSGRLEGVRFGALNGGALTWRLPLGGLFQGKIDAPVSLADGDVVGEGRYLVNMSGDRRLIVTNLRVAGLPLGDVVLPGETTVTGFDVFFDAGACARAEGQVNSDVLVRAGQTLGFEGPPLSGPVSCEGEDAVVALTGENASGDAVLAVVRLKGDGQGVWRLSVRSDKPEAQIALAAAGFTVEPEAGEANFSEEITWLPF